MRRNLDRALRLVPERLELVRERERLAQRDAAAADHLHGEALPCAPLDLGSAGHGGLERHRHRIRVVDIAEHVVEPRRAAVEPPDLLAEHARERFDRIAETLVPDARPVQGLGRRLPPRGGPARAHVEQALAHPLARELVGGPTGYRLLLERLDSCGELRGNTLELEAIEHRRERAGRNQPLRLEARRQGGHAAGRLREPGSQLAQLDQGHVAVSHLPEGVIQLFDPLAMPAERLLPQDRPPTTSPSSWSWKKAPPSHTSKTRAGPRPRRKT